MESHSEFLRRTSLDAELAAELRRDYTKAKLSDQDRAMLAAFKAVEAFDPAVNRWQILPSMPHQRHGLAAGVVGSRFYAVSGDAQSAGNGIEHSAVGFNEALQLDLVLK